MTQTFDIRFSNATGLAAFFAVPENGFRWKGDGQLTVDESGVTVRALSKLLFLRSRRVQFSPSELRQAWREGAAVRLEFNESRGAVVLPVWATSAAAAAEMMRALPTTRTVELEYSSDARASTRYDRRLIYSLLVVAALAAIVAVAPWPTESPQPLQAEAPIDFVPDRAVLEASKPVLVATTEAVLPPAPAHPGPLPDIPVARHERVQTPSAMPASEPISEVSAQGAVPATSVADLAPASASEAEVESFVPTVPVITVGRGDLVIPLRQNTVAYDKAWSLFTWFEKAAKDYNALLVGNETDQRVLNKLETRWRNLATGLLSSPEARTPELTGLRGTLLAVVSHQRNSLNALKASRNGQYLDFAYNERTLADQAMERARQYLR